MITLVSLTLYALLTGLMIAGAVLGKKTGQQVAFGLLAIILGTMPITVNAALKCWPFLN